MAPVCPWQASAGSLCPFAGRKRLLWDDVLWGLDKSTRCLLCHGRPSVLLGELSSLCSAKRWHPWRGPPPSVSTRKTRLPCGPLRIAGRPTELTQRRLQTCRGGREIHGGRAGDGGSASTGPRLRVPSGRVAKQKPAWTAWSRAEQAVDRVAPSRSPGRDRLDPRSLGGDSGRRWRQSGQPGRLAHRVFLAWLPGLLAAGLAGWLSARQVDLSERAPSSAARLIWTSLAALQLLRARLWGCHHEAAPPPKMLIDHDSAFHHPPPAMIGDSSWRIDAGRLIRQTRRAAGCRRVGSGDIHVITSTRSSPPATPAPTSTRESGLDPGLCCSTAEPATPAPGAIVTPCRPTSSPPTRTSSLPQPRMSSP